MSRHAITFGDIRGLCSRIDPVSVCFLETMHYENFRQISEVPHSYDQNCLYGFGMIESEFTVEGEKVLLPCLEFMLQKTTKEEKL